MMKSEVVNAGFVKVDGIARRLTHVFISIVDEKRCTATNYHEVAYSIDGYTPHVEIIETQMNKDAAETLFYLLNTGKVSIDTRISMEFANRD